MPRPKVSDYDKMERTRNFIILEDLWAKGRKPTVIRTSSRKGYNHTQVGLTLLDGEWPDMKDFCDNHLGAIPQCGGHDFREANWSYDNKHLSVIVWGCD